MLKGPFTLSLREYPDWKGSGFWLICYHRLIVFSTWTSILSSSDPRETKVCNDKNGTLDERGAFVKMIAAKPNVVRIIAAMNRAGWGVRDTCVNCGMNNKTLAKILKGEMPHRLDAFYRLCEGLKIPIQEALINGSYKNSQTPNLTLIEGRLTNRS